MSPLLFQQLTASELNRYASELDHAIENHSHWLGRVNRALICGTPAKGADLSDAPHTQCQFGRWLYGIDCPDLHDLPEFRAMEEIHEWLHHSARGLLLKARDGKRIEAEEYDELLDLAERLRCLAQLLRTNFKRNLNLIQKLMGKVFEKAAEGVMITEADGTIVSVNQAFCEVTGFSEEEVIGRDPSILYSGRQDHRFYRRMWELISGEGQWQGEIWNRRKNGEIYPEWLSITAIKDEKEELAYYVAIFSDITSEKENEERLYRLAHFDTLTGLPNRMLFLDRMRQALSRARRQRKHVAVMFLDLDGFKEVNDALGHNAGDELLQQVAQRLAGSLRESDTVSRFGGDEFTVVIPDMDDPRAANTIAEKIIDVVNQPCALEDGQHVITASLGVSLYPNHGNDPQDLVSKADAAMYEAKKRGKNTFCYFEPGKA